MTFGNELAAVRDGILESWHRFGVVQNNTDEANGGGRWVYICFDASRIKNIFHMTCIQYIYHIYHISSISYILPSLMIPKNPTQKSTWWSRIRRYVVQTFG